MANGRAREGDENYYEIFPGSNTLGSEVYSRLPLLITVRKHINALR